MSESDLVFLLSQPRSGSTLTQKILGAHSEIYTRSETWMMFPPAYTLKNSGMEAEYNANLQYLASRDFILNLPDGGMERYISGLKSFYLDMYGAYAAENVKRFFLDKTPRYYLIYDQLKTMFSEAKYLLLLRNPLAVLSSMIAKKSDLSDLYKNRVDLFSGPDRLIDIISESNCFVFAYEQMLENPTITFESVCDYLKIPFEAAMIENFLVHGEEWPYGDKNIYVKKGIDCSTAYQWIDRLKDPQYWRLLYDYLQFIGEERMAMLGYNFEENLAILDEHMPVPSIEKIVDETRGLMEVLHRKEANENFSHYD